MRHPIRMQISDPDFVLSDLDQHQIENMIWLRLSPFQNRIEYVKFEIHTSDREKPISEHFVRIEAKLISGHTVDSYTAMKSKDSVLVISVYQLKEFVEKRILLESRWWYRFAEKAKALVVSFIRPNRNRQRPFQNPCSSAAPDSSC